MPDTGVTLTMDDPEFKAFQNAIHRFREASKADSKRILDKAAVKFIHAGRTRTKKSQRMRDMIDNPGRQGVRNLGQRKTKEYDREDDYDFAPPYAIVVRKQNGPSVLLTTRNRNDPRRVLRNSGLAKQSWSWLASKLGGGPGRGAVSKAGYRGRTYNNATRVQRGATNDGISLDLTNSITYMEKAFPGITRASVQSAADSMKGELATTGGNWKSKWDK